MGSVARNYCVYRHELVNPVNQSIYTVPQGHVLILKSIVVANMLAATAAVGFGLVAQESGVIFPLPVLNLAASTTQANQYWFVMNAGDVLQATANPATIRVWVSGALLSGFTGVPVSLTPLPA